MVEISQTVGQAMTKHYGCRSDWGAMNYLVHEEVEQEEAGETEGAILEYIRTADDRRVAEDSMREMHRLLLLKAYATGLAREYLAAAVTRLGARSRGCGLEDGRERTVPNSRLERPGSTPAALNTNSSPLRNPPGWLATQGSNAASGKLPRH